MRFSELTKPEIDVIVGNANFTEEEKQVFDCLCKAKTIEQMEYKLKLSGSTISRIVLRIKIKVERIDKMKLNVPIWEKVAITVEEAAEYSNIGINKISNMLNEPSCPFVLFVGKGKRLVKRKEFERYLEKTNEI